MLPLLLIGIGTGAPLDVWWVNFPYWLGACCWPHPVGGSVMGYAWAGVCYPDIHRAAEAFSRSIPNGDGSGINAFSAPPVAAEGGSISWTIINQPFDGAPSNTVAGVTHLLPCTDPDSVLPSSFTVPEMLMVVGMVILFSIGFRTGFR